VTQEPEQHQTATPSDLGEARPVRELRTSDIKCLSCGAYNIPENIVCGACGANLPLIYDKDGKVFRWESDSPYWAALQPKKKKGLGDPNAAGWMVRGAVVIGAVLFALYVMSRRG
jgi:hypothetical protein